MKKTKLTTADLVADIHPNGLLFPPVCKWRRAIGNSFASVAPKWRETEWLYFLCVADLTGWEYENSPLLAWTQCETMGEMINNFEAFPGHKYRGDYVPDGDGPCFIVEKLPALVENYLLFNQPIDGIKSRVFDLFADLFPDQFDFDF